MENKFGLDKSKISSSSSITPSMKLQLTIVYSLLMFPLKYLETKIVLIVPLPSMVTILITQSCITLASCKYGHPSSTEYLGSIALLFMTMKVTMYNMPWILILIWGIIPKCLLNEKSAILKLNGVGWVVVTLIFALIHLLQHSPLTSIQKHIVHHVFSNIYYYYLHLMVYRCWSNSDYGFRSTTFIMNKLFTNDCQLCIEIRCQLQQLANGDNNLIVHYLLPYFLFNFQSSWGWQYL